MRHSLLKTLIVLLGATALATPAAGKEAPGAPADAPSIEAGCAAELSRNSDVRQCITRRAAEWQRAQYDAARPDPVSRPDAPDVELDWTPPGGFAGKLRLSLNDE